MKRKTGAGAAGDSPRKRGRSVRKSVGAQCPFCGEVEDIYVDPGGGESQEYVEDCAVCCRPRIVHVEPGAEPGEVNVWLERDG